jgi:Domain of unknown function (DUF6969)
VAASGTSHQRHLSPAEAARLEAAAGIVAACRRALAAQPGGIFAALAAVPRAVADWQHYPPGDVYDPQSHAQYFYHAHPAGSRAAGEHGHFHTFLRAEGMPPGVAPLVLPETALPGAAPPPQAAPLKRGGRDEVSHLVAVALDHRGDPIRLFTTNRWVTGETWYRADDVIHMLDRFALDNAGGPTLVNAWLCAVLRLYRPQIALLLRTRDQTIMNWRRKRRTNVFEDARIEVTSSLDIDLDERLAALDLLRQAWPGRVTRLRLPPMADGWN